MYQSYQLLLPVLQGDWINFITIHFIIIIIIIIIIKNFYVNGRDCIPQYFILFYSYFSETKLLTYT